MVHTINQFIRTVPTSKIRHHLILTGIFVLYALLMIPTINRLGIGWDEEIDLRIAQSYLSLKGFFFGLSTDLSQTRLPMFSVALIFRLIGVSNLLIARLTSVAVGGLTLYGIYYYGKQRFTIETGLLAAGILAVSPFFLSFSRLAFTESDIYLACLLTWLLVSVNRLLEAPNMGRAAVAGVLFGLSLSAKATVLVILPALWVSAFLYMLSRRRKEVDKPGDPKNLPEKTVIGWSIWTIVVLLGSIYTRSILDGEQSSTAIRLLHYLATCLGWLITFVWILTVKERAANLISIIALVTSIGLLTFHIFPPDHATNSGFLRNLFSRAGDEMGFNLAFIGELAALHLLILIFKSTPLLGLGLIISWVVSLTQWRRKEFWLPLLVTLTYFCGLLALPLAQTFYTIPILPLLSMFAAYQFIQLWSRRRNYAIGLVLLTCAWLGVEMVQVYPDFHLNGYQWLGVRSLFGRSSIGYRSVVFTPADGVQQALEWIDETAKPGQTIQLFVEPWHIVRFVNPEPAYQLENGFQETLNEKPDFVVHHINALISQGAGIDIPVDGIYHLPFDPVVLESDYEKVFTVQRAFNIEVASVWQRK